MLTVVDGDTSLVVADETLIGAAERHNEGIVPLYYNMRKGKPTIVTNDALYKGMITAFTGGNIGEISNSITKIWNSENPDIDAIKILCMKNNETIDFAKTLYKSPYPSEWKQRISDATKGKVPAFFTFAKGKSDNQVSQRSDSCVDRLYYLIKTYRFNFNKKELGTFDYRSLMSDPWFEWCDEYEAIINRWKELTAHVSYRMIVNTDETSNINYILRDVKNEMLKVCDDEVTIVDVLTYYLFGQVNSKRKNMFWNCYADIVLDNLKKNIDTSMVMCARCGKRFIPANNKQKYCDDCAESAYREVNKKYMQERRMSGK